MLIYPAIDLFDGKAVRLFKGDYAQMTVYNDNPVAVAEDFLRQGASCIHLVDLEGAKSGTTPNLETVCAIKKATDKDVSDYKEMVYEGYGPFGIAIVVETATDNTTRTVANVRSYFNRHGGSLGTSGSLEFLFDHKCVFKVAEKEGVSLDELELELIDYGVDEVALDEGEILLYGDFKSYSGIQTFLEENGFEIHAAEFERIPHETKPVNDEQRAQIEKLLDKFEEDEDVQNVFHNMSVE